MRPGRRLGPATLVLVLLSGEAGGQAPPGPELERAAEARAMARACREFRPELAERVGRAFEGWWERNSRVANAVHALHFGVSSPEQAARQQAFEALQERLLTDADRSRATDPEAFAERCRRFVDRLEGMARPDHPEPLSAHDMMG